MAQAAHLPLIGVWIETRQGVRQSWSTSNIEGSRDSAYAWAFVQLRNGAMSCAVREFDLASPEAAAYHGAEWGREHLITILDWRDLPENAEQDDLDFWMSAPPTKRQLQA